MVSESMKQRTARQISGRIAAIDVSMMLVTNDASAYKARLTTSRRELVSMAKKLGITQYIS